MFYERNFKAERFEHFHRSHADVRFVITHERVVPKNDCATVLWKRRLAAFLFKNATRRRVYFSCKPSVEAFTCIMRQRASSGDSNCFFHCDARRLRTEKPIRQPRHETAEFA